VNYSPENIVSIVETMFKYKGTNYAQVASKLRTKNGTQMSRQVLYRMVNNGTITLALFIQIVDLLGMRLDVKDEERSVLALGPVKGDRVKKKLKGIIYDSDKMFSVAVIGDERIWKEVCLEPVSGNYVAINYCNEEVAKTEEGKKYPFIEKIEPDDFCELMGLIE